MPEDLSRTEFGWIIEGGYEGGLSEGPSILAQAEAETGRKMESPVERIMGYTQPALALRRTMGMLDSDDDEPFEWDFDFPPPPEFLR